MGRRTWAWRAWRGAVGSGLLALSAWGCGGEEGDLEQAQPEVDREGLDMCCDLGALCHPLAEDPLDSPKRTCHALGHQNDPAACRAQFDSCMEACFDSGETAHGCI
jgi:hypothetical protein